VARRTAPNRATKPQPVVKAWDFRSYEGVDRVALAALRGVSEHFGRLTANRFGVLAKSKISVHTSPPEQVGWEDFETLAASPGVLATFSLGEGQVFVHMPARLAMALVDLYLAGPGTGTFPDRALTETESKLLSPFLAAVAEGLADAASSTFGETRAGPVSQVTVASGLFLANRRMPCVTFKARAQLPSSREPVGEIGACLPVAALRPLLAKLTAARPAKGSQVAAARAAWRVPLTLSLRYPTVAVPLQVAQALAPGQVLSLGHPVGEPLLLCVGDKPVFVASPVERAKRSACQVIGPYEAPEKEEEN
jgi:flagellar motor switch protein FliM